MSYSLNSLKGVIWGIIYGTTTGDIKGDTRSLDNGSYGEICRLCSSWVVTSSIGNPKQSDDPPIIHRKP